MLTTKDTARLLGLKKTLEALSPGDRLRVAAACIDKGEYAIAESIASTIVDELAAIRVLRKDDR